MLRVRKIVCLGFIVKLRSDNF